MNDDVQFEILVLGATNDASSDALFGLERMTDAQLSLALGRRLLLWSRRLYGGPIAAHHHNYRTIDAVKKQIRSFQRTRPDY